MKSLKFEPDRRKLLVVAVSATAAAALSACTSTSVLGPFEAGTATDATAAALPIVNAVRARQGLTALSIDKHAVDAARDQALRMASRGQMRHDLGSDRSFLARMKRLDVRLPAAENIAAGQDTVDEAVAAWIRSKKHLENMMGSYRGLGVAVARNDGSGNRPYWSMVLSNPDSSFF